MVHHPARWLRLDGESRVEPQSKLWKQVQQQAVGY